MRPVKPFSDLTTRLSASTMLGRDLSQSSQLFPCGTQKALHDQLQHCRSSLRPPMSPFIWVKLFAPSSGLSAGYLYCSRSLVLQNSWRASAQQPCHENQRPDLTADCFRFQLPSSLRRSKVSFKSTESVVDMVHPMSRLIKSAKAVKISLSCKMVKQLIKYTQ